MSSCAIQSNIPPVMGHFASHQALPQDIIDSDNWAALADEFVNKCSNPSSAFCDAVEALRKEKTPSQIDYFLGLHVRKRSEIRRRENEKIWNSKPAMTMRQYIQHLDDIDLYCDDSVERFLGTTCPGLHTKPCDPIILGHEGDTIYQLESDIIDTCSKSPKVCGRKHPWFDGIEATRDGAKSPVRYFLPLGYLYCVLQSSDLKAGDVIGPFMIRKVSELGPVVETPYYVVLNVLDLSLWMVLASRYSHHMSYTCSISADDDTWNFLCTDSNGRQSFDIMKIMDWGELYSLDPGTARFREFFAPLALDTADKIGPQPVAVTVKAVEKAMDDAIGMSSVASDDVGSVIDDELAFENTEQALKIDSTLVQAETRNLANTMDAEISTNNGFEPGDTDKLKDTAPEMRSANELGGTALWSFDDLDQEPAQATVLADAALDAVNDKANEKRRRSPDIAMESKKKARGSEIMQTCQESHNKWEDGSEDGLAKANSLQEQGLNDGYSSSRVGSSSSPVAQKCH